MTRRQSTLSLLALSLGFHTSHGFIHSTSLEGRSNSINLAPQQLGVFEALEPSSSISLSERRVVLEDLVSSTDEKILFEEAWSWQKCLMQQHVDRIVNNPERSPFLELDGDVEKEGKGLFVDGGIDTIFMLEHEPVYTLGTGSDEKFILGTNPKVPTVRMDRGGEVTYHGPGQLVVYPVLDLRNYKQDIHWYMRALEECVLIALRKCGLQAERQEDTTGIWIDNHKVAAVGVKCRKWITQHGLAVNIEPSTLDNFQGIVPCGLEGRKVGYVNQFLPNDKAITVREFAKYMKEALAEVFQVKLQARIRNRLPEVK